MRAIAPSRVRLGIGVHGLDQPRLEVTRHRCVALRGTVLPDHPAGPTFGDLVPADQEGHRVAPPGRTHHFPDYRSFNIEMSSACFLGMMTPAAFAAAQ